MKRTRHAVAIASLLAVTWAGTAIAQTTRPQPNPPARIADQRAKNTIPGQYIVVFKPGTSRAAVAAAEERAKALGATIGFTYTSALTGFSVKLPNDPAQAQRALQMLRESPGVAYVEADQKATASTMQPPSPATNPPDGLDRIDRRLLPLNTMYSYSETGSPNKLLHWAP